ncbi:discoidin domain-containing protein [bacterium]|nr:discoidin domain-containing protein [bacterium]
MKFTKYLPLFYSGFLPLAQAQLIEVNVAELKPTFGDTAFGAPTSRGNDGIDGTIDTTNWTHADYPTSAAAYPGEVDVAPNPYWQVNLDGDFDLTRVQIVDRVDCCDPHRLNGSTITFFDGLGAPIGSPVLVDGLALNNPADTAVLEFDNAGAGWAGVAAIRIDGVATNQYFQFSEFRAFSMQPEPPNNVALGAPVTSSAATWGGQGPENITDGSLATQSHPLADFGTLGFTYSIDLGQDYNLKEIVLINRADGCCPERLSNYRVSLHIDDGNGLPGDVMWTADVRTDGSNSGSNGRDQLRAELDAGGSFLGRHITIENLSDAAYNPQIAEVQAFTFDDIPDPPENFALGAIAGYFNAAGEPVPSWGNLPVSNVTDGIRTTVSHPLDQVSNDYYLEIDLGETVAAGSIVVTGRLDACCRDRLEDARMELLDEDLNVVFTQVMTGQVTTAQTFEIPGGADARYVRIFNANGAGYGPQIAEVEVYGPEGSNELQAEIVSVEPSTGKVSLSFNSSAGKTYAVFASSTLLDAEWEEVVDNVLSQGAMTTVEITDSSGVGSARRFYRVGAE